MLAGLTVVLAGCRATLPYEPSAIAVANGASHVEVALNHPASQEVAVNPMTNTIWLATVQPVETDTLWAIDMSTGEKRSFELPTVDYNGYTTHVRVGPDGAMWVSLPYELARWDPVSENVASLRFTEEADGALPGALDRNATLPGTWLSAILPDGTGVLVARNHVPYLTHVSADMTVSRGATVPDDYAGAADLLRGSDGSLLSGARGPWTRVNSSGTTVQYDPAAGTLTRHESDGSTDLLQLEQFQGEISGGGIDPDTGKKTNANTSVTVWDRVTDFVVAGDSTVWILRHNGTQLVRWNP